MFSSVNNNMEGFVNANISTPYLNDFRNSRYSTGVAKSLPEREQIEQQNLQEQSQLNQFSSTVEPTTEGHLQASSLSDWSPEYLQSYYNSISLSDLDKTVVDTVIAPNQNRKQRLYAAGAIGGSVLVLGGATLAMTRGKIPKTITNTMGKLMDNINKRIDTIKQKPSTSKLEGTYLSVLQGVNDIAQRIRGAIFNISPLKDVVFEKFVRQTCKLGKPCDAITNSFRKLSFATVKSSYRKASRHIDEMTDVFSGTNARLASGEITGAKPLEKGVLKSLTEKTAALRSEFGASFAEPELVKRSQDMTSSFDGLGGRVYDRIYGDMKGFVKDVNEWTTFVPEAVIAKDKAVIMENLAQKRRIITNSPDNNYNALVDIITNLENSINPSHKESREMVKTLRTLAKQYVAASGEKEAIIREKINTRINAVLKDSRQISNNEIYTKDDSNKIMSLLRRFGKVVNTDKKGYIEDILSTYREILPEAEYLKVKNAAQKAIDSINKAVHREGFEYVDKLRDLATGSALTDVAIGMGVPVAATAVAVSAADTKEKKQSVVLKYGLPLLVGIATTTVSTIKLISGGKSLMLGALTSTLTNEVCERIDEKLKLKKKAKQKESTVEDNIV
ncbi:MAG: hypothetical protein NC200_04930 [Candidatus Gastranaerophilales bacterium]|nr:hypothetical protein [Candidatus Gastranaerophilales bacterium]